MHFALFIYYFLPGSRLDTLLKPYSSYVHPIYLVADKKQKRLLVDGRPRKMQG